MDLVRVFACDSDARRSPCVVFLIVLLPRELRVRERERLKLPDVGPDLLMNERRQDAGEAEEPADCPMGY